MVLNFLCLSVLDVFDDLGFADVKCIRKLFAHASLIFILNLVSSVTQLHYFSHSLQYIRYTKEDLHRLLPLGVVHVGKTEKQLGQISRVWEICLNQREDEDPTCVRRRMYK